jgi:glutathione S-transferase
MYAGFGRIAVGLEELDQQLRSEGKLSQDGFTLVDACVIAFLLMFFAISSDEEFNHILDQDDRKLRKLYKLAQPYLAVDEGEWDKARV